MKLGDMNRRTIKTANGFFGGSNLDMRIHTGNRKLKSWTCDGTPLPRMRKVGTFEMQLSPMQVKMLGAHNGSVWSGGDCSTCCLYNCRSVGYVSMSRHVVEELA